MDLLTLIAIAVGLAMDATAVSVATGLCLQQAGLRQVFRMSFHFGLFQAGMPVLGWFLGKSFAGQIESWDHWVAFGLLALIGIKMIYEAVKGDETAFSAKDPTRGGSLIFLSVATSIDALAVGISFAVLGSSIVVPALTIGGITMAMSATGLWLGCRLGHRFERGAGIAGGLILLGIGIRILVEHLLA